MSSPATRASTPCSGSTSTPTCTSGGCSTSCAATSARVVAAVGDDHFHNLVTDYLLACPSTHPSVRNVGARLADFLATQPLGAERPWLVELARLERARVELFDGPDAEPLTLDDLRALRARGVRDAAAAAGARRICSSTSSHAVDDVWRAVENEQPVEPPAAERAHAPRLAAGRHRLPSPARRRGARRALARPRRRALRCRLRSAGGGDARRRGGSGGFPAACALGGGRYHRPTVIALRLR